jgi:hypothetical protein
VATVTGQNSANLKTGIQHSRLVQAAGCKAPFHSSDEQKCTGTGLHQKQVAVAFHTQLGVQQCFVL